MLIFIFSNIRADFENAVAPTVAVKYHPQSADVKIISYGFNGAEDDGAGGESRRSFYVRPEGPSDRARNRYLLVVGGDIADISVLGYVNGACNEGEESDGTGADFARYETELNEIFPFLLDDYMEIFNNYLNKDENRAPGDNANPDISVAALKAASEFFTDYGPLSDTRADRYSFGMLDELFQDVLYLDRIFFLTADINIGPYETAPLDAVMIKRGSYDFYGTGSDNWGAHGYDMLTRAYATPEYDVLTASLSGAPHIEILRQNFGFDISNNILKVKIDPTINHYYIEVRKPASSD